MADNTLIQGLLQSLLPPQQPSAAEEGMLMAKLLQGPNPVAAYTGYMIPQRNEQMRRSLGTLFGRDMADPAVAGASIRSMISKNPELLQSADGLAQMAQVALKAGDNALGMRLAAAAQATRAKEEADRKAVGIQQLQRATGTSSITNMAKTIEKTDAETAGVIRALENSVASGALSTEEAVKQAAELYKKSVELSKQSRNDGNKSKTENWLTPTGNVQALATDETGKVNIPASVAADYKLAAGPQDPPKGWRLAPTESNQTTKTKPLIDASGLVNWAMMTNKLNPSDMNAQRALTTAIAEGQVSNTTDVTKFFEEYAGSPVYQQKQAEVAQRALTAVTPGLAAGEQALKILEDPEAVKKLGTTFNVIADYPLDTPAKQLQQALQPILSTVWLQTVQALKKDSGVGTSAFSSNAEGERVMAAAGNLALQQNTPMLTNSVRQVQLGLYNMRNLAMGQPPVVAFNDPAYPQSLIVPGSMKPDGTALYQITPSSPPIKIIFRKSIVDALETLRPSVGK